ncbi:MAG: XdhC family protein [Candidatus Eremiobacteraeota bacterium]|nr:XdhC family protein [Candidatus Eremiobacteraeota bacterium]
MCDLYRWLDRLTPAMALATVVRTSGSTYRKVGARMVIDESGEFLGLVSGGCLEREVARRAQQVLADGKAELVAFDTRQFLGCDGLVEIVIEPLPADLIEALRRQVEDRRQDLTLVTPFTGGTHLGEGQPEGLNVSLEPPRRLLIFGSGVDVAPLAAMAECLGFETVRLTHPADPARPSGLVPLDPAGVARRFSLDHLTAAVVMNHHYGNDLAFLAALWSSPVGYLGCVGSRARRERLLADLAESGIAIEARPFYSPAGLDLGGEGPEAIALSVLAEIQMVFSGTPHPLAQNV